MKIQISNISFKAGLTKAMKSEIVHCDVQKVSNFLAIQGIESNFKNNKTIAWCCLKCVELINHLKKQFKIDLGLPNGIFVEDFNNLRIKNTEGLGLTNFAPTKLNRRSTDFIPEKTIFFNEFEKCNYKGGNKIWDEVDYIADVNYEDNINTTNFFLETFLHEFFHIAHENNLIKQLGPQNVVNFLSKMSELDPKTAFQSKYQNLLKEICTYAIANPLDAVACDLCKRSIPSVNKNTLLPTENFIKSTPYENLFFMSRIFDFRTKPPLDKLLKDCWNGKLDF